MRVLEVLATLKRAGAENVVGALATGLDRSRFDVRVVSLYDAFPGGLESALAAAGVPVWHLGKRHGFDPRIYGRVRGVVREFQPDIIHTHSYVMRYTLHLRARAMVHTVHNLAGREVDALGRMIHRYGFRRGVVPVAVGTAVEQSFRETYGFAVAATIPNGIDIERFWQPQMRQLWREANGFRADDLLIVSTARLEPQKNPVALAEAFRPLSSGHLLLAGDGSLRRAMEGRERVHVLGVRDDIADILAAADIFALASDWEGYPIAVMEAMAAGLPVVATAVGGVPELVEHGRTGLLVPARDAGGLSSALAQLADDPDLRSRMAAAARERAMGFSVRVMVGRYSELFERLLCESRS